MPCFLWGILALWWGSRPAGIFIPILVCYVVAHFSAIVLAPKRFIVLFALSSFSIPLLSFLLMEPSNHRPWQEDVALLPYAEFDGGRFTLHNVRNCDYVSEFDYTPKYETRTYDFSKLKSVDVMLTDWGLKYIAHTMVSFGFEGDDYLCFSIETRKEEGEAYSAVKGFFRQYELIYIAGDERDLVRLRTDFRVGENVYLYRIRVHSMENMRGFLDEYLYRINRLHEHPEWYNALTENCMTSAFRLARKHSAPDRGIWHWSVILNGFADRRAYEMGTIDNSLPFDTLKRLSCINEQAKAAENSPEFSKLIRKGLPGMDRVPEKGRENE
ncbi:MAG: DUF4105 domain-containing protein [Desulfobacteraceae bacterium]|nr:DUF4105 domain-containing protein [Desulfobacteraceae bacterium]